LIRSDPILTYPNFNKKFTLTTDASNFALGAVLSQDQNPICFASRTLNEHETWYSVIEKELLAIVWATNYFRCYLYGRKFKIISDHKPLAWLHNVKEPNMKLQRWIIRLNEYDFKIEHIKGKPNFVADALSRVNIKDRSQEAATNFINNESDSLVSGTEDFESLVPTIHSAEEDGFLGIPITERRLNIYKRQLIFIKSDKEKVDVEKI